MDRRPTKLAAELASVYGVPSIMAGAVLNPVNKVFVFAYCFKNELENLEIAALAIGSDKIGLPNRPFSQNRPNGAGMIFNMNPITYIKTVAIQLGAFTMFNACNGMRNELFWMLVRAVVITAI